MKKSFKRKSFRPRRRKTRRSRKSRIPRMPVIPFPNRRMVKLEYFEKQAFSIAYNTLSSGYIYQSSLYDPRYSVGGHQPLYYDELTAVYRKYRVFGISYDVQWVGRFDYATYVIMRAQSTPVLETDIQTVLERSVRAYKCGTVDTTTFRLRGYASVAKVLGIRDTSLKSDDWYSAETTTSPVRMIYLIPYIMHEHPSSAVTAQCNIRLTYHCEFFDRVAIGGS